MGRGAVRAARSVRRLVGYAVFCLGLPLLSAAQTVAPAQALGPVEIPEGTPVLFHLYGGTGDFKFRAMLRKTDAFYVLIQVDQDTIVNHVVVVPRGAVGQAKVDPPKHGRFRSQFFSGYGTTSFSFVPEFVFSAASTKLEFTSDALLIDDKHKNVEFNEHGVIPLPDVHFSATLKHASMDMNATPPRP